MKQNEAELKQTLLDLVEHSFGMNGGNAKLKVITEDEVILTYFSPDDDYSCRYDLCNDSDMTGFTMSKSECEPYLTEPGNYHDLDLTCLFNTISQYLDDEAFRKEVVSSLSTLTGATEVIKHLEATFNVRRQTFVDVEGINTVKCDDLQSLVNSMMGVSALSHVEQVAIKKAQTTSMISQYVDYLLSDEEMFSLQANEDSEIDENFYDGLFELAYSYYLNYDAGQDDSVYVEKEVDGQLSLVEPTNISKEETYWRLELVDPYTEHLERYHLIADVEDKANGSMELSLKHQHNIDKYGQVHVFDSYEQANTFAQKLVVESASFITALERIVAQGKAIYDSADSRIKYYNSIIAGDVHNRNVSRFICKDGEWEQDDIEECCGGYVGEIEGLLSSL